MKQDMNRRDFFRLSGTAAAVVVTDALLSPGSGQKAEAAGQHILPNEQTEQYVNGLFEIIRNPGSTEDAYIAAQAALDALRNRINNTPASWEAVELSPRTGVRRVEAGRRIWITLSDDRVIEVKLHQVDGALRVSCQLEDQIPLVRSYDILSTKESDLSGTGLYFKVPIFYTDRYLEVLPLFYGSNGTLSTSTLATRDNLGQISSVFMVQLPGGEMEPNLLNVSDFNPRTPVAPEIPAAVAAVQLSDVNGNPIRFPVASNMDVVVVTTCPRGYVPVTKYESGLPMEFTKDQYNKPLRGVFMDPNSTLLNRFVVMNQSEALNYQDLSNTIVEISTPEVQPVVRPIIGPVIPGTIVTVEFGEVVTINGEHFRLDSGAKEGRPEQGVPYLIGMDGINLSIKFYLDNTLPEQMPGKLEYRVFEDGVYLGKPYNSDRELRWPINLDVQTEEA